MNIHRMLFSRISFGTVTILGSQVWNVKSSNQYFLRGKIRCRIISTGSCRFWFTAKRCSRSQRVDKFIYFMLISWTFPDIKLLSVCFAQRSKAHQGSQGALESCWFWSQWQTTHSHIFYYPRHPDMALNAHSLSERLGRWGEQGRRTGIWSCLTAMCSQHMLFHQQDIRIHQGALLRRRGHISAEPGRGEYPWQRLSQPCGSQEPCFLKRWTMSSDR